MEYIKYIFIAFLLVACGDNDNAETVILDTTNLADLVAQNDIEIDNVIACASGSKINENDVIAYVYPRPGVTDIRYYETSEVDVDKNEYQNYTRVDIASTDFFNGYLQQFTRTTTVENWVIITFFEDGKLQLSNPIRLKHKTRPTEFTDEVTVNNDVEVMPLFSWDDGVFDDNAIYFQVISDTNNDFLSGTYTFEKSFQYYILDNVVLNITREIPPQLDVTQPYNFTLMGVSEDNWVNLFIESDFSLSL